MLSRNAAAKIVQYINAEVARKFKKAHVFNSTITAAPHLTEISQKMCRLVVCMVKALITDYRAIIALRY